MMDFNMRANIDVDTSTAEHKLNALSETARGIAENQKQKPLVETSPNINEQNNNILLQEKQTQQIEKTAGLVDGINSLSESFKILNESLPIFIEKIKNTGISTNQNSFIRDKKDEKEKSKDSFFSNIKDLGLISLLAGGIAAGYEQEASGIRKQTRALTGDTFGMKAEEIRGNENVAKSWTSVLPVLGTLGGTLLGNSLLGSFVGTGLKGITDSVIGGVANKASAENDYNRAKAELYKQPLENLEKSMVYYDMPRNSSKENRVVLDTLHTFWKNKANDTGLSTDDFTYYANSLSQYGNMTKERAGNITHNAGILSRFLGTDIDKLLNFMGERVRFGSENTKDELKKAYFYSQESGLGKGQFEEFLDGLQSAVEQGISKGYIASTEDISKQMLMFSKLSNGNDAWEGKYGFQKLSQINSGLANATSLSNSGQILAYQAMRGIVGTKSDSGKILKGGAYIDGQDALNTLSLMESGLNPDSFRAISKNMKNMYGNDVIGQVAAWKELTGLNYTGAMQLYEMSNQEDFKKLSKEEQQKEIDDLFKNEAYQSDSKKMQNSLNEINDNVRKIAIDGFDIYLNDLSNQAGKDNNSNRKKMHAESQGKISNEEGIDSLIGKTFADLKTPDNLQEKIKDIFIQNIMTDTQIDAIANKYGQNETNKNYIYTKSKDFYTKYSDAIKDGNLDNNEKEELIPLVKMIINALQKSKLVIEK